MIIILEGENKTGKSTLAKKILDRYDFDYVKCSQPKGDPYLEYMNILKRIEKTGRNTVIDRFLYGEFVYGPIYRGKSSLSMEQKRNIELKAISLNAIMIYCHDKPAEIAKRFRSEKEEFADEKLIKKTLRLFDEILQQSHIPYFVHQMKTKDDMTKGDNLAALVEAVSEYDKIPRLKTAVGNVSNQYIMLVGEKRNERLMPQYKKYRQPFDFGVTSQYLFSELTRTDIPLCQLAFMNSDSKELKRLRDWTGVIVAMGNVATERLMKLGIDHCQVWHPSYERRFKSKSHMIARLVKEVFQEHYEHDES